MRGGKRTLFAEQVVDLGREGCGQRKTLFPGGETERRVIRARHMRPGVRGGGGCGRGISIGGKRKGWRQPLSKLIPICDGKTPTTERVGRNRWSGDKRWAGGKRDGLRLWRDGGHGCALVEGVPCDRKVSLRTILVVCDTTYPR